MSTSSTLRVSDRPGVFGGNFVFRISSFRIIKICIMSKEESTILKGIAILLMLFLHLFNKATLPEMCHPMIYIGDTPLVHILTRATNPVDFFVILYAEQFGANTISQPAGSHTLGGDRYLRHICAHGQRAAADAGTVTLGRERCGITFWNVDRNEVYCGGCGVESCAIFITAGKVAVSEE